MIDRRRLFGSVMSPESSVNVYRKLLCTLNHNQIGKDQGRSEKEVEPFSQRINLQTSPNLQVDHKLTSGLYDWTIART